MIDNEWSSSMLPGRREDVTSPISEGEWSTWGSCWFPCRGATGGCSGVVAADSQSRAASGLTRGGRQSIRPVGPKVCLGQILL
jgi:hypothetical protein